MTEDIVTVPNVDLERYLGRWFEIARKPMRHEDAHASDVVAEYSLNNDGSVRVLNSCLNDKGEPEQSEGRATAVDGSNAKLEVSFLPQGLQWIPFTKGDYWIIRLDDDYATALVGGPDRKYLWLLSRDSNLNREVAQDWLRYAESQGYDIADVIWPRQSGKVHGKP
ncbi:lipocalin family protein [Stenotrophomonas sp. SY1]|uniref:lipocalin family protein n=1 Tax=Stenotrophomonas sp. SY1 TaxID=477235 RepID=UPI001E37A10A|nr:lipocalin family protein [Stenotrophomonas sp. SY1]MCD9086952.1 lipocalin family protein [Stenotrophomonas sp. SY1]